MANIKIFLRLVTTWSIDLQLIFFASVVPVGYMNSSDSRPNQQIDVKFQMQDFLKLLGN